MSEQQAPIDLYLSVLDWLMDRVEPYCKNSYLNYIYSPARFKRQIRNAPAKFPKILEGGHLSVIPNGRVWGENGAIITPNNKLLWDVSLEYIKTPMDHSIFKEKRLPPISQHYDKVADITHIGSGNYYHWMFEVLPRIHLLQLSGIEVDYFIVKYEPEKLPGQNETLSIFGINETNMIKTHPQFHIEANKLVLPSQTTFFPTQWGYNFLRKVFLKDKVLENVNKKRVYISRKKNRRIINEEDLLALLSKYGFIKVELENLSVAEQVQLFNSAEAIISPHGAGLTNLAFCNPGTKVIEIFPPTYVNCLYWIICSLGYLDYHFFIGDYGERDPEFSGDSWAGLDNIRINISQFEHIINIISH